MYYIEIIQNAIKIFYNSPTATITAILTITSLGMSLLTYKLLQIPLKPSVVAENYKLPLLSLLLYTAIYIVLLLILRYYILGKELDLKELLAFSGKILIYSNNAPLIINVSTLLLILILIIFWVILIIKTRSYL